MSLSYKVENVSISAVRDRAMFNTFAGNESYIVKGIGNEMAVTYNPSSFVVTLGTGEAVICGGSTTSEGETNSLTLDANQEGYLVIEVNLALTGDNICQFKNVSTIVQGNINNGTDLIYDMPLYQYRTGASGVSTMTDMRKIIASSNELISETLARVATTGRYSDLSGTPAPVVVDNALSTTSTNPVQNKVINSAINGKAPTNHASTASTYGLGTTANYGHVKTINALTQNSHQNGTALSAYQGYLLNQNKANVSHTHGYIQNNGSLNDSGQSRIGTGDRLVITDENYDNKLVRSSITFDTTNTSTFLSRAGTWLKPELYADLLYTNPRPNDDFVDQDISIPNLSSYSFVLMVYKLVKATNSFVNAVLVPYQTEYDVRINEHNGSTWRLRGFRMFANKIATTQSTDNSGNIPWKIYGFK